MTQLINNEKNVYFRKQLHHSSVMYKHSQIIPSSQRTKADKIKTLRQIKENKLQSHEYEEDSIEDEEYDLDIEIEDLGEIEEKEVADVMNYYRENIFNREDFHLYRAIMHFYSEEYDKAIADFQQTSTIMHANKHLHQTQNNFTLTNEEFNEMEDKSQASSQTDLSDVGLCSLNVHEFSYNTVLCLIKSK